MNSPRLDQPPYVADRLAWRRRASLPVRIGSLMVGGHAPVVVQSMCTTPTQDVAATVAQCIRLAEVGCQLIRITAPGVKDAAALGDIRRDFSAAGFGHIPLCADIHFMPKAALEAIEHVEKVRVNPGNFADKKQFAVLTYDDRSYAEEIERVAERFRPLVCRAKELGRALRIGVNHGSLSDRILNRWGDTPAGMVEAALEFIDTAEGEGFRNLVVSMKSSNPKVMVQAYRLLVARLDVRGTPYPLHLGVTEAGDGEDGRSKGAAGIGGLLEDGLGDTIRVSLTEPPEAEIPVAQALARRYEPPPFSAQGVPGAPTERLDPYRYQRRPSETLRMPGADGQPVVIGGGSLPKVLVPHFRTTTSNVLAADVVLVDGSLWGAVPRLRGRRSPSERLPIKGLDGALVQVLPISDDHFEAHPPGPVLFDLDADDPALALDAAIGRLTAPTLLGIGDPGALGATRAYRLLAAIIEARWHRAEAASTGSGLRHPLLIALPHERDPLAIAAVAGGLLIDGLGDALYLPAAEDPTRTAFTVLQAVKARVTRTDYVACPSCGRTLFDLMEVTEHIRSATNHLDGVTIAIMGCIVNGPGEMADADFGFVGSGPGKIDLYHGKERVQSNIPFVEARERLIQLIKDHGRWKEPSSV
jgi:(E)-4-hydroxy-3-methylbut-2-enyl-diphosphate synthase